MKIKLDYHAQTWLSLKSYCIAREGKCEDCSIKGACTLLRKAFYRIETEFNRIETEFNRIETEFNRKKHVEDEDERN